MGMSAAQPQTRCTIVRTGLWKRRLWFVFGIAGTEDEGREENGDEVRFLQLSAPINGGKF